MTASKEKALAAAPSRVLSFPAPKASPDAPLPSPDQLAAKIAGADPKLLEAINGLIDCLIESQRDASS